MRELRRIGYLCFIFALMCGWSLGAGAQEEQNANLLLRKSAVAYQELDSYQDVAVMKFDFGGEGIPEMKQMMEKMGDMMKIEMHFTYKKPKKVLMDINHTMYSGTTVVDGATVTQLIGSFMGQPLNEYVQKPLDDGDVAKALKSMSDFGGQSGNNSLGLVYMMMVSDNPLASFTEQIKSVTFEREGTVQCQVADGQNEIKEVYILDGEMDAAALGMPGMAATAKIYMDKTRYLIHKVDTHIDFDLAEAMKNVPANMRGNAPAGRMQITASMDHTNVVVNEPISDEKFVFTPPEGAKKTDSFDMQAIMQKMGGMPGMNMPGAQQNGISDSGSVGQEAKKATLKSLDGDLVSIPGDEGDVVVLYFFASWSGSCKRQTSPVTKLAGELKEQGVVFYGLNNERNEDNVKKYVEENGVAFPVLMDDNKTNFKHYDITTLPAFVIIDNSGTVVQKLTGMQTEENLKQAIEEAAQ